MHETLKNRIAIISGASAGIGKALALGLANSQAKLVINARRSERLAKLTEEINSSEIRCAQVVGDASKQETIDQMLDCAVSSFGHEADLIVVNAGRGVSGSVLTSDVSEWAEVVQTNLIGACLFIRAAAQRLIKLSEQDSWPGKPKDLIILGSIVGRHISPFSSMYGATKFGVNSVAEAVRRELAPKGIRVTLIEPAIVRSEFQAVAGYQEDWFKNFGNKFEPLLDPEDVARAILFIASQPPGVHISDIVIRPTKQDYP